MLGSILVGHGIVPTKKARGHHAKLLVELLRNIAYASSQTPLNSAIVDLQDALLVRRIKRKVNTKRIGAVYSQTWITENPLSGRARMRMANPTLRESEHLLDLAARRTDPTYPWSKLRVSTAAEARLGPSAHQEVEKARSANLTLKRSTTSMTEIQLRQRLLSLVSGLLFAKDGGFNVSQLIDEKGRGSLVVCGPKRPSGSFIVRYAFWLAVNELPLKTWSVFTPLTCKDCGCVFRDGRVSTMRHVRKVRCASCRERKNGLPK